MSERKEKEESMIKDKKEGEDVVLPIEVDPLEIREVVD